MKTPSVGWGDGCHLFLADVGCVVLCRGFLHDRRLEQPVLALMMILATVYWRITASHEIVDSVAIFRRESFSLCFAMLGLLTDRMFCVDGVIALGWRCLYPRQPFPMLYENGQLTVPLITTLSRYATSIAVIVWIHAAVYLFP